MLFLGVFYHLRHPLLALDLIHEHVARDLLVFQSMQRGSAEIEPLKKDYAFTEVEVFDRPGFPKLHFIERRYAGDPTNWWAPNRPARGAVAQRRVRRRRPPGGRGVHLSPAELPGGSQSKDGGGHDARSSDDLERAQQQIHWDFAIDPDWSAFAEMARSPATRSRRKSPGLPRVLGGISPIDPLFIQNMQGQGSSSTSTPWPCTGSRWTGTIGCSTSGRTS